MLEYLNKAWSSREIEYFIYETEKVLNHIKDNPYMYKVSKKKKNVRKGFVTKHNSFYYRVKPRNKEIEVIKAVIQKYHHFKKTKKDKKLLYLYHDTNITGHIKIKCT